MPIGKNAIKRVSSSNASSQAVEAVVTAVAEPKAEEKVAPVVEAPVEAAPVKEEKPAAKKPAQKKAAPKKSMEKEPDLAPLNTVEKVTKKSEKAPKNEGISHFYLGDELPYYLL